MYSPQLTVKKETNFYSNPSEESVNGEINLKNNFCNNIPIVLDCGMNLLVSLV